MWLCDRKRHLPGESEVIDERLPALSRQRVDIRCPPPDQRSKAWESGFAVGKSLYRENKVPFGPAPRRHIASGAAKMNNVRYTAYVFNGVEMFRAFSDPYACEIDDTAPDYAWRVVLRTEPNRDLASGIGRSMEESVKAACVAMAMLKKHSKPPQTRRTAR